MEQKLLTVENISQKAVRTKYRNNIFKQNVFENLEINATISTLETVSREKRSSRGDSNP